MGLSVINETNCEFNCDESYYLTIPKFDSIKEFNNFVKEPIRK
ncbi:MAG: hypothetical protein ABIH72_00235 [archaeon]